MKFILTGGSQGGAKDLFKDTEARYKEGLIAELDIETGKVEIKVRYQSPKGVYPSKNPAFIFKTSFLKDNMLYCCTRTEVMLFRLPNYELVSHLSLSSFHDLHHVIPSAKGGLLVASTGLDLVQHISDTGQVLQEWDTFEFNTNSTWDRFDKTVDYRLVPSTQPHKSHPNHICEYGGGIYVTRFHQHDVIELNSGSKFDIGNAGAHDGMIEADIGLYTTVDGNVYFIDVKTGAKVRSFDLNKIYPSDVAIGWCRSVYRIDDDNILVGFTRLRPTAFTENLRWLKTRLERREFVKTLPTRCIIVNLSRLELVNEFNLEAYEMNAVFSCIRLNDNLL